MTPAESLAACPEPKARAAHLAVLAYANGFTWWLYQSPHPIWDCRNRSGYWDDVVTDLDMANGDLIHVVAPDYAGMMVVQSHAAPVSVVPLTAIQPLGAPAARAPAEQWILP